MRIIRRGIIVRIAETNRLFSSLSLRSEILNWCNSDIDPKRRSG